MFAGGCACVASRERQGVLGWQALRFRKVRNKPQRPPSGQARDLLHAVREKAGIAPELIDDEPLHKGDILGIGHHFRSGEARDDAAAVDVANENDGHAARAGEPEIGDVVSSQVDLGHGARAFDEHEIRLTAQTREAIEHGSHELRFQFLILGGLRAANHAALHHNLRPDLTLRLQQNGVHMDAWRDPGGASLESLRPSDLAAIGGDGRVVRHVLRLERPDFEAALAEGAGKPRDDDGLAYIGAGPGKHDRAHEPSTPRWNACPVWRSGQQANWRFVYIVRIAASVCQLVPDVFARIPSFEGSSAKAPFRPVNAA